MFGLTPSLGLRPARSRGLSGLGASPKSLQERLLCRPSLTHVRAMIWSTQLISKTSCERLLLKSFDQTLVSNAKPRSRTVNPSSKTRLNASNQTAGLTSYFQFQNTLFTLSNNIPGTGSHPFQALVFCQAMARTQKDQCAARGGPG